ncbi:hypothetical protein D3C72_2066320 [compost metagenome]
MSEVSALSARLDQFNLGNGRGTGAPMRAAPAASAPARPVAASPARSAPVASPARALGNRLAAAIGAKPAPASSDWEEF